MRISDWSSDVCSSDLVELQEGRRQARRQRDDAAGLGDAQGDAHGGDEENGDDDGARHAPLLQRPHEDEAEAGERKSVVSGKRVSVRVELGGSRTIKKKKKQYTS